MVKISVLEDDITQVPADGLITGINSSGRWLGAVDGAIIRCAGDAFHRQTVGRMLVDGGVIYAPQKRTHSGRFTSVVFVVDDFERALQEIVLAGLLEADRQRLGAISVPIMRTGMAQGMYESSAKTVLDEMVAGIKRFLDCKPIVVEEITLVVYKNPDYTQYLRNRL